MIGAYCFPRRFGKPSAAGESALSIYRAWRSGNGRIGRMSWRRVKQRLGPAGRMSLRMPWL